MILFKIISNYQINTISSSNRFLVDHLILAYIISHLQIQTVVVVFQHSLLIQHVHGIQSIMILDAKSGTIKL